MFRQVFPLPGRQVPQPDMHDPDPVQGDNAISQLLTHATNLPVPPLRQNNLEFLRTPSAYRAGTRRFSQDGDPLGHAIHKELIIGPVHPHEIFFFMAMLGPEDLVHDVSIIGQQDQA